MNKKQKMSFTTQNRLIVFGLMLSTLLIMSIAVFAAYNIQQNLSSGYQNFGQIISKAIAVESSDIIKSSSLSSVSKKLKNHSDLILKSQKDVILIEFQDKNGNILSKAENKDSDIKPVITVSSPIIDNENNANIGSVIIGMSGNVISKISKTTRASILFVFTIVWIVFAFVILINTYLITRELKILHDGVKRITSGEFGYEIVGKGVSEEVHDLFDAFNDMSHRLHLYEEENIEQLTLERNKLKTVLMSIANGVVVCDKQDNVTLINNHAKELLELQGEQLLDTDIKQYVDSSGNYCFTEKINEYKNLSFEEKTSRSVIFNIKLDDKVLKAMISPMLTRANEYIGYIIVLIDVTRETEMDEMKSHFISNVSHELRTPVTVLRSYIDTLYNYGADFDYDSQKEFIGTINTEIIRLQNMVNDILDFSRLDSNAQIEKTENNISQLIDYCVKEVQPLLSEHNLKIDVEKDEDISQIMCNYDAIASALTNYLSNAIKYAPSDSTITVRLFKELDNNQVVVTVRDEGEGISPEFHKKIFDRFFRVENKTHSVKGTGLGLHLVKTTIEKHHNGHVFVNSDSGAGATFGFTLPIDDTSVADS